LYNAELKLFTSSIQDVNFKVGMPQENYFYIIMIIIIIALFVLFLTFMILYINLRKNHRIK